MDYPHFKESELVCKCGKCDGKDHMDPAFMKKLEAIRIEFGKPMPLSSAYRCPAHNLAVATTGEDGPHTTGRAVDVEVLGEDAFLLTSVVVKHGITGIGASQKGPLAGRFIHLDDLEQPHYPRPRIWTY